MSYKKRCDGSCNLSHKPCGDKSKHPAHDYNSDTTFGKWHCRGKKRDAAGIRR